MTLQFLTLPDRRLAYQRFIGQKGRPGVIFLGGFASDMTGTKATFLEDKCKKADCSYIRFDYRGHGQSDTEFKEGTIGSWLDDACEVFKALTDGPQIVVGSSMGGWIGLILALKFANRIKSLVGIAAAPDFTEDLLWLRMTDEQRSRLERDGFIYDDTRAPHEQAPLTKKLIDEGRQHLLLSKVIPLECPVRLLQGLNDSEVPWQHALRIVENVATPDVRVTFIKEGDHRLSRAEDLDLLWRTVEEFVM